ncbi:MAG TPA: GMC oxidoreductase [Frateuria sp.]|uniref:GMC oxidoreductase n=1 Tax=Frateuria sp. TaxID=2211372 RepID=UPI002DF69BA9|nr:GMC oxidoreductase [Frateuria sp.]
MVIDFLDESAPTDQAADICIVGAGAAGLAMAHAFIGTSLKVCLIESGGYAGEERNQALYEGHSVGSPAFDAASSRMRVFGGSCNLWGGGCMPLSALDLSPRDWVPHSGWPLSPAELAPYYQRARRFCGIETHALDGDRFLSALKRPPVPLADTLVNQIFVRSSVLFGQAYRAQLERAPNITVLLHANLLELLATPDGAAVRHACIGALSGRRGKVRARHFVLACGGIENARLLLLSDSVLPKGLGNRHGLVGRYFMDHPSGKLGTLHAKAADRLARPYDRQLGKGVAPFPEIGLSEQVQRAHRLLNGRVHPFAVEGPVPRGLRALRGLRAAMRTRSVDENGRLEARLCAAMRSETAPEAMLAPARGSLGKLALQLGMGMGDVAHAFARRLVDKPAVRASHVQLVGYFEQAPNPDSRVSLGEERDALGQRKVRIDWRLTALDRHTYRTAANLFGTELARACDGRFEPDAWLSEDNASPARVRGTAHHLGTTRMADDPGRGVVDRHCRVHGMDNLHVAGSSVFPTGGWAFPTFTIIALSLRLADRLQAMCLA